MDYGDEPIYYETMEGSRINRAMVTFANDTDVVILDTEDGEKVVPLFSTRIVGGDAIGFLDEMTELIDHYEQWVRLRRPT